MTDVVAGIPAATVTSPSNGTTSIENNVTTCRNLRPADKTGQRLVPVDDFSTIADIGNGFTIIGMLQHPISGQCVAMANGHHIVIVSADTELPGKVLLSQRVESNIVNMLETAVGHALIMTEKGSYTVECDNTGFSLTDNNVSPGAAMIYTVNNGTLTADIPERKLATSYDRTDSELDMTDTRRLALDLRQAYRRLQETARHSDINIEPVLIRYRYLDYEGNTVGISPVKMLVPPEGVSLCNEYSCAIADGKRRTCTLSADTFSIVVETPAADEAMNLRIASMLVETAPAIPIVDIQSTHTENRLDIGRGILRFFMPGAAVDRKADDRCTITKSLLMLRHFNEVCTVRRCIDSPFGASASQRFTIDNDLSAPCDSTGAAASTASLIRRLASQKISRRRQTETTLSAQLNLPHRFTAATGAVNGDSIVWGGLQSIPFNGWDIKDWALATDENKSWNACVIVEFSDGMQRAVWSGQGTSNAPVTLTPLLYYPSENAVTMEVRIRTSSGTATHRVSLTPLTGYGLACNNPESTKPITLVFHDDIEYIVPVGSLQNKKIPGVLISAFTSDPLALRSLMLTGKSDIVDVRSATAGSTVWEFARHRFYIFGKSGTSLAVTNSSAELVSLQILDRRKVLSNRHITLNGDKSGIAYIAGGRLITLDGNKAIATEGYVPDNVAALAIDNDDLWIGAHDGKVYVRPGQYAGYHYVRDTPAIADIMSDSDRRAFIITSDGLLLDGRRRYVATKEIEWSCRIELPDASRRRHSGTLGAVARITAIGLRLICSAIKARFIASTDSGSLSETLVRTLLSALLEGSLRSTLFLPARTPSQRWITLTLRGTVSPDTRFHGASLHFD